MIQPGNLRTQPLRPVGSLRRMVWLDTSGLLYGTIVSAAALAAGAGQGGTPGELIDAMASTLVIYWLAHVYTTTISGYRARAGTPLRHLLVDAARREAAILLGGLPALTVVVVEYLTGVRLWLIVLSALGTAIAMLSLDGFLAGTRAGVTGWRLAAETGAAAVFGGLIAALLVSLHTH